jgi:hypothetical protein
MVNSELMLGETKTYILSEADGAGGVQMVSWASLRFLWVDGSATGLFFLSSGSCCSVSGMEKEEQKENKEG